VSFDVAAEAYGRFMGRFAEPLAGLFADRAGVVAGMRALDVGCGPGALTAELARRLGPGAVTAIDPSASFVAAVRERLPQVEVSSGAAEQLPFPDGSFDAALAQLVVHFMADPVAGLAEMRRVAKPGGRVAACVWDHGGDGGPLSAFWRAARDLDPDAPDETTMAGVREGHLVELGRAAGLTDIESSTLSVRVDFTSFDEWWEPFLLGVGRVGEYLRQLDGRSVAALRDHCAEVMPAPPFTVTASAWCVVGRPEIGQKG
jgi:SAM-dependent methyltransferase